ncbi:methyltransferase domain-containing protein [Archangium violaceum]|uniref:methyltransferase domain-containing protein n=1 Tax=Archangium violaceum TaxID=83451 RepID=UPI002B31E886|nr:methyltransferase domain-containing protein [Archangium violaceum]
MANLRDLPRQAWGDLQSRLFHLPLVGTLRNLLVEGPELSSPVPRDTGLVDAERVAAYQRAIERYVKPGQVVADVGTGSGLRAFLAARRGPSKLYAVDRSRNLDTARWVARRNGLSDIAFVRADSSRFQPAEKVDVLLHEQVGDALFDTGLVPKLLGLRDRVLARGGRILPNRFEVFFEPVQLREEARLPFIWNQRLPDVDFTCLQVLRDTMNPAYFTRFIRPQDVERRLCDAEPAFALDLETLRAGSLPTRLRLERPVVREGRVDGLCLFYRAGFDSELSFDTFPDRPRACTPVLLLRVDPRDFARYETIRLELSLPELADVTTWRWSFV